MRRWQSILLTVGLVICAGGSTSRGAEPANGWSAKSAGATPERGFNAVVEQVDDIWITEKLFINATRPIGYHGWFEKRFAVEGGKTYGFQVERQTENVKTPRRSAIVRIVWQDDQGRAVTADPPTGRESETGSLPLAEPEHPLDGETKNGWTTIAGTYRAPSKATRALVELHLQWTEGKVEWRKVTWKETKPPPARKVRLAAVHYRPSGKSPQENNEEYAPLIAQAAEQKADLVVLGETIPYVGVRKKPHEVAESVPGPSTKYFGELAAKHKLHIVTCVYENDKGVTYNTAALLGPDGKLIGKYRKVCLPHSEIENGVTPGSEYPVFETSLGKIGLMICYDGFFPEVARELTNNGAEIIAWPVWGCNPLLARARACENHVYVVSSTYTDAKSNWMISAVIDHAGDVLAAGKEWGDVAIAEVDLSQRHFWRNNLGDFHNMVQRHRPE
jgi:predicted amidohydrolase